MSQPLVATSLLYVYNNMVIVLFQENEVHYVYIRDFFRIMNERHISQKERLIGYLDGLLEQQMSS